MKTKIISQVHDSIIADVPLAEVDDYLALANDITTRQLQKAWDWIKVALDVEAEMVRVDLAIPDPRVPAFGQVDTVIPSRDTESL